MTHTETIRLTVEILFTATTFGFFLGIMILFFGKR